MMIMTTNPLFLSHQELTKSTVPDSGRRTDQGVLKAHRFVDYTPALSRKLEARRSR